MEDNSSGFDFRNFTEEDLMQMDVEELKQLKGLMVKHKEKDQAEIQEFQKNKIKQDLKSDLMSSNTKAAIYAGAHGFTAGGIDEFSASLAAVKDTIEATADAVDKQGMSGFANTLSTWNQSFAKRHDEYNRELKQLEQDHPNTFTAADMAGTLALGALTGGTAVGTRLGASLVGRVALAAGEGLLHGTLRSDAETLGGRVEAGAEGAGWGAAMGTVATGASKLATKAMEKVGSSRMMAYLADSYKNFASEVSDEAGEFFGRIVNYTDESGNYILRKRDNAKQALDRVRGGLDETNRKLGDIYDQIDNAKVLEVDADYVYNRLADKIVDPIADFADDEVGSQAVKKVQAQVKKKFMNDFTMDNPEVHKFRTEMVKKGLDINQILDLETALGISARIPKKMTLSNLNRIKNDYFSEVLSTKAAKDSTQKLSAANHIKKGAHEITSVIDELIGDASSKLKVDPKEGAEKVTASLYDTWKGESKKFKDLLATKNMLTDKTTDTGGKSFVRKVFLDHWGKMSVGAAVGMQMYGASYSDAAMVVGSLGAVASIPTLNRAAGMALTKMATSIKKDPDKYANLATRLAVSAGVSSNAFYERLLEASAEVDLTELPLQRNTEDLISRQDSVLTLMGQKAPHVLRDFKQALRKQDKNHMALILTSTPELKEYLAPGMGWEGKALSQEEQSQVMDFFKKNLKPRQRRKAMLKFAGDFMIPETMLTGQDPKSPETVMKYVKKKNKLQKDY